MVRKNNEADIKRTTQQVSKENRVVAKAAFFSAGSFDKYYI